MVKTASLRLDSLPMSGTKRAIEEILDHVDKSLFESGDLPYIDFYKPKKEKDYEVKNE